MLRRKLTFFTGDTQPDALKRQTTAAAGSIDSKARRICASFNGDMKGLMQILGLAGPAGTYNCIFCLAHKNQTSVAGLPCLRYPPEPWASKREHLDRPLQVRDPPLRGSTEDIAARAAAYQRDAAAKKDLSSGAPEYQSCIAEPLFWSDDLVEHVSKMPLHVLLGIGTNRINRIEADALKFDEAWAGAMLCGRLTGCERRSRNVMSRDVSVVSSKRNKKRKHVYKDLMIR